MVGPLKIAIISHLFPTPRNCSRGVYVYEQIRSYPDIINASVFHPVSLTPPKHVFLNSAGAVRDWAIDICHQLREKSPSVQRIPYPAPPKGLIEFLEPFIIAIAIVFPIYFSKRRKDIHIIHAHFLFPDGVVGSFLTKLLGKKLVITIHGSDINQIRSKSKTVQKLGVFALKSANKIIAVSSDLKTKIMSLGIDSDQIEVIPNGVDLEKFHFKRSNGIKSLVKQLLFIGYLRNIKGVDILIEAIALVKKNGTDGFKLIIVGEGPLQNDLLSQASDLGIGDCIEFIGAVPHATIPQLLKSSDLLIIASRNEGWPTIINEAFSCGTPVVATRVGGIPEAIPDERLGLLAEKENPVDLAEKISLALDKEWDIAYLRDRAIQYSWKSVAEKVVSVYYEVLKVKNR